MNKEDFKKYKHWINKIKKLDEIISKLEKLKGLLNEKRTRMERY